jgi:TonB family protein
MASPLSALCRLLRFIIAVIPLTFALPLQSGQADLEQDLSHVFVGRSFTIRNFYQGTHLRYSSGGDLLNKNEPGYWSRDGMVKIASVKVSREGIIVFQGDRYCVLFSPDDGEFSNVRTGDKVEIQVDLPNGAMTMEETLPALYKVFITGKERLPDLVPAYWKDCLSQKVERPNKHSAWECVAHDRSQVPDFRDKKVVWDIPPRDTSLHNGMQFYALSHRIQYLAEDKVTAPGVLLAPDPLFQWEQRRTALDAKVLVLAFTVGESGKAENVSIVSPVGMGLDDDAAHAITEWKFKPGIRKGKPYPVFSRVLFEINAPNARPIPR